MKTSKNRVLGKVVKGSAVAVVSMGILFPPFQSGFIPATAAKSISAEQILSSLTKEQREALTQLQVADERQGLQGFEENDLKSDKEISVIVEFKSKPGKAAVLDAAWKGKSLTEAQAKKKIEEEHTAFQNDVKKILPTSQKSKKSEHSITRVYKTAYNGVSMKLPANEVEKLLQSAVVKALYKNVTVTVEPSPKTDSATEQGSPNMMESVPCLGIDKLHKEGYTEKGVKVAVIDTGIDYNHPDLKEAFKGGYDFVDNDSDPMETTYEDWEKSGQPKFNEYGVPFYTSHGTHVSGTVAGQGENSDGLSVTGVAPDANLYVYRVLGP
ncbi:S8 family serine peptidase [Bacillus sp. 165]|uniref:S8 family serine peptidase n=1 Tax=Bacillus sp. 165 TaxID=1529117 RepID=UPI001AD9963B|nr:S8 family serine peptidase [Bacillus sp. 165]MBO9130390.1 S8 family serine peptidase [Bacillus sp. 165]